MKFVQYTNNAINTTAANTALPIGILTQKCMSDGCQCQTFTSGTSGANIVNINEAGKYRITYTASLASAAAGNIAVALNVNGNTVITSSATVAAADDFANIGIDYIVRICNNCSSINTNLPATVQLVLGSTGVNSGVSNLIIEKIG